MNSELKKNLQTFKHWRHDLHQHPELGFNEHRTAKKVASLLRDFGLDEVHEGLAKTGVIGLLRNGEGSSIGLRADMDALPIDEHGAHNYRSVHPNVMHACGHDGHTVMLLAAAQYLAKHRNFSGTVVFIFQPAEEYIQGAPALLKDGLLTRFPFDSVYTLHSWPGAPTNNMFADIGPVMACVNNFEITIKGKGGHAAMPHMAADPIVAGSAMVTALQTINSRKVDPQDPLVLSITVFQSGKANNVIPGEVTLKGTVRFVKKELATTVPDMMQDIMDGIARAHGVSAQLDYTPLCPATYNTEKEALLAREVIFELFGKEHSGKEKPISMGADDFCFYLEEVPGAYVYIGNGEGSPGLHHHEYDFNDEAILTGAQFYIRLVEKNQAKNT